MLAEQQRLGELTSIELTTLAASLSQNHPKALCQETFALPRGSPVMC